MSDLAFTPSDIVGAIQRGLGELAAYLNAPVQEINASLCVAHMQRLTALMERIEPLAQAPINPNAHEARAN